MNLKDKIKNLRLTGAYDAYVRAHAEELEPESDDEDTIEPGSEGEDVTVVRDNEGHDINHDDDDNNVQ